MARGSLARRKGKRGWYWRLRARDAAGHAREIRLDWKTARGKVVTTRPQAETRLAEFVRELQDGPPPTYVGRDRKRILFGDVAHDWWAVQTASARTKGDYRTLLNSRILPVLGNTPIASLTKPKLQRLLLQSSVAPATANKALFITKSILEYAVEIGLFARNPAQTVKRLRVDRKPLNVWTPDQVEVLLDSFPPGEEKWRVFCGILFLAVLRFGEAAALTPQQVTSHTIIVDRAWDERMQQMKPTKSGRARSVDMHPRLKSDLLQYVDNTGMERDALLFPGERRGKCLSNSYFSKRVWQRAIKRAGLPLIRPHDARHTFVTHLLEAGANPVYVKEQPGHFSAGFTLDVYGHRMSSRGTSPQLAHNQPTNRVTSANPV